MTANTRYVALAKDLSTLVRPRFGPGMLLQHDDLEQLSLYTRELSRLMFRTLFGCGVMCGLVVKVEPPKCGKVYVVVTDGVGLDCAGDPVYVPKTQRFAIDEKCEKQPTGTLWVVLCRTEKCCAPRTAPCPPDNDEAPATCTRERDGFEIRVVSTQPECVCGCPEGLVEHDPPSSGDSPGVVEISNPPNGTTIQPEDCRCANPNRRCYRDHYDGKCGCHCDDCSDCDCRCILLARLINDSKTEKQPWKVDHSVRRFVRPVLMRDPEIERDKARNKKGL